MRHAGKLGSLQFSPAGEQVLTSGADGLVKIWRADTGALQLTLTNGGAGFARFSPDGRWVLTSDEAGAYLWDARTGYSVSEAMLHSKQLDRARFTPGGKQVLTTSLDLTARYWDVNVAPSPVAPWLADLAEALAGRRLNARRDAQPVSPQELLALKERLSAGAETDFYSRWTRWFFVDRLQERTPPE